MRKKPCIGVEHAHIACVEFILIFQHAQGSLFLVFFVIEQFRESADRASPCEIGILHFKVELQCTLIIRDGVVIVTALFAEHTAYQSCRRQFGGFLYGDIRICKSRFPFTLGEICLCPLKIEPGVFFPVPESFRRRMGCRVILAFRIVTGCQFLARRTGAGAKKKKGGDDGKSETHFIHDVDLLTEPIYQSFFEKSNAGKNFNERQGGNGEWHSGI